MNWFNQNKMIKELEKGKTPIDVSIIKWSVIFGLVKEGQIEDALDTEDGDNNCACCYFYRNRKPMINCRNCPIWQYLYERYEGRIEAYCGCVYTPYAEVIELLNKLEGTTIIKCMRSIEAELDFLYEVKTWIKEKENAKDNHRG